MDNSAVRGLSEAFLQTLSSQQDVRKKAEENIKTASTQDGFALAVLQVVSTDAPIEIRQAAAVNFKNFVKYRWAPTESVQQLMKDAEKEQIKSLLTGLMVSTPPLVRAQLSEALSVISSFEFPAKWPTLLPELISRLDSGNASTVHGVLETANSIYKRYRNQFMSTALSDELSYSQQFVQPLLKSFQGISAQIKASSGDLEQLRLALSSARLVLRIFFSLNSPGLTEDFENVLDTWMEEFHFFLTYDNPALAEKDPDKESIVDAVKAAVCQNINLFMEMNEEEFAKYLGTFAQDVWTQLTRMTLNPGQDNLAMSAIRFLTTLVKGVHHGLFQDEKVLQQVCEQIVIPNIRLRDDLEEMFDMNWVEYVRRDTEGSDMDTRRRAATDLVKALTSKFEAKVTELFTGYVGALLAEHAQNPTANWKAKDCAIYLVVALTVRGRTAAQGATTTNQLVNIGDFYSQQIAPELTSSAVDDLTILKADALKFLTILRGQLPTPVIMAAFGNLVALLGSDSNVVHSYAAIAIERLLASKENGRQRFSVSDLQAQLMPLLNNLFGAFQKPESGENEYLMKTVMRVITFVGPEIAPVAALCLERIAAMLLQVCQNPTQPGFNHYLFESVAALIRYSAAADISKVADLESNLFPAFNVVLQQDEFHPYVFQIFAQLIELRTAPLPELYMTIFKPLLAPLFWERPGNVPALTRLLQAYLVKAGAQIAQQGLLQGVLGIFQKLVASKAHDQEGFRILEGLITHMPPESLQQYMPTVWSLLFQRLQAAKTSRFVRGFLVFLSHYIVQRGPGALAASVDAVQPGILLVLLQQVWLPNMASVRGETEEKLMAVATTKLVCELPALQTAEGAALWGQLLGGLLKALEQRRLEQENGVGEAPENHEDVAEENQGYAASFAQLHNAAPVERDPVSDVADAKTNLAASLSRLSQDSAITAD
ncbi:Cse1-domain-containing protein [Coccomyxa subellipsoidea C-169]|uniref:Cse1-domain-containing protein n=1 Tax=Coccomyxa subellipsoidea (strain C-169) TaxID=574566 RepID=I0Z9P0_COCSC|nr:Cse1-domain-containing protein [Coccomyxa subellipsoidea C-169]EIE27359.1 Cse1-domain-containing protein [Coccomyxa subellipsoidea C-169]|eukprot:XP_005651903.1 Cse1-domain-containing protein [Coccomyxa subellipsoidea C-169]